MHTSRREIVVTQGAAALSLRLAWVWGVSHEPSAVPLRKGLESLIKGLGNFTPGRSPAARRKQALATCCRTTQPRSEKTS